MANKLMTFEDIIGHKNLINFLRKRVAEDNVVDVIIFHGNPGLGKSSLAKILAVEIAYRYASVDDREKAREAVILKNQSTDSIKLFNMSEIQEKEEEIQKVKADLSLGFSSTGRKVLILDEAHNMSKKAQDDILIELEHLQQGIYVFICTTEISSLRAALKSRSKATYPINELSDAEAKQVVTKAIAERQLTFDINVEVVKTLICDWARKQPRAMCNLLENFAEGSCVSSRELEVFINVSTAAAMIELLKYLYGSMMFGIEYLESMKYDESFATMLIEVCKAACGYHTKAMSRQELQYIKEFMKDKDSKNILKFTAEVAGLEYISKRRVISAFMKAHVEFQRFTRPEANNTLISHARDIQEMSDNMQASDVRLPGDTKIRVPGLDEFFTSANTVVDSRKQEAESADSNVGDIEGKEVLDALSFIRDRQ